MKQAIKFMISGCLLSGIFFCTSNLNAITMEEASNELNEIRTRDAIVIDYIDKMIKSAEGTLTDDEKKYLNELKQDPIIQRYLELLLKTVEINTVINFDEQSYAMSGKSPKERREARKKLRERRKKLQEEKVEVEGKIERKHRHHRKESAQESSAR